MVMTEPRSIESLPRLARSLYRLCLVVTAALCIFKVVHVFEFGAVMDDAFIFQRYAHNLLAGEGLRFNPGGEPTYGLTALLFVVPAALGHLLAGSNPLLGALLASCLCGLLMLTLAVQLLWEHVDGSRTARLVGLLLFATCLAWSATPEHFASGMDTTFALAYLAGLLIAADRFERRPGQGRAITVGVMGGLAFWVRPDLASFGLALPAAMVLWAKGRDERRHGAVALGVAVAGLAALLAINRLYFSSALPLAFYAKSPGAYEGALARVYGGRASEHLLEFVRGWWPVLLIVGLEVVSRSRSYWRHATPLDKGALAATLVCMAYYWLLALPVVADGQRFFQPAALACGYLAARTVARWERELGPALRRVDRGALALAASGGMVVLLALIAPIFVDYGKRFSVAVTQRKWRWDPLRVARLQGPSGYWFKLPQVTALPDELVIATTEVGFLGALNPHKTIIDMAGLNERRFAHQPFDPGWLLDERRPDWIYMPHEDYGPMVQALLHHPSFQAYEHHDKHRLKTRHFGVALRKDSPHYPAMRELVDDVRPPPLFQR